MSTSKLFAAVAASDQNTVRELLATAVIDWPANAKGEESLLHEAARVGDEVVLGDLLVGEARKQIDAFDEDGIETPLLAAIGNRHTRAVETLLRAGPNSNHSCETTDSCSPLGLAIELSLPAIVYQLLEHGARPKERGQLGINECQLAMTTYAERKHDPLSTAVVALLVKYAGDECSSCLPIGFQLEK